MMDLTAMVSPVVMCVIIWIQRRSSRRMEFSTLTFCRARKEVEVVAKIGCSSEH